MDKLIIQNWNGAIANLIIKAMIIIIYLNPFLLQQKITQLRRKIADLTLCTKKYLQAFQILLAFLNTNNLTKPNKFSSNATQIPKDVLALSPNKILAPHTLKDNTHKARLKICGFKVNCKFTHECSLIHKMTSIIKHHPALKIVNRRLVDLPSPLNINTWWNFGSLLGLCLGLQLLTGVFLAMHFTGDIRASFERVRHLSQDVPNGWLLRTFHANGARFFFFCLYFHAGRGLYYGSFAAHITWSIGTIILLIVIAAAFLGYVLPWGQISFWGTTVITNLLSAIPYIGDDVVIWLWGGFAVGNPTLTRFFAFHFLVPFIVTALVIIHLLFLHQRGSNNPLGLISDIEKIPFQPYFTIKDLLGFFVIFFILGRLVLKAPWILGDPENFIPANPLVTPVHIQPEWYFLFAYAILRSIPNKLGGVIALVAAVLILLIIPLLPISKFRSLSLYPLSRVYFWILVSCVLLLTWIGARPVEEPYIVTGQILTVFYFIYFFVSFQLQKLWDKFLL